MIGFGLAVLFWIGTILGIVNDRPGTVEAGFGFWLLLAAFVLGLGLLLSRWLPTTVLGIAFASVLGALVAAVVAVFAGQVGMVAPLLVVMLSAALATWLASRTVMRLARAKRAAADAQAVQS